MKHTYCYLLGMSNMCIIVPMTQFCWIFIKYHKENGMSSLKSYQDKSWGYRTQCPRRQAAQRTSMVLQKSSWSWQHPRVERCTSMKQLLICVFLSLRETQKPGRVSAVKAQDICDDYRNTVGV